MIAWLLPHAPWRIDPVLPGVVEDQPSSIRIQQRGFAPKPGLVRGFRGEHETCRAEFGYTFIQPITFEIERDPR